MISAHPLSTFFSRPLRRRIAATLLRTLHTPSNQPSSSTPTFLLDQSKSFLIGSLAGLLGSLAGMGGGFVMIPLMTARRGLGMGQHQAHGTSLFAVGVTGLAGAAGWSRGANDEFLPTSNTNTTIPHEGSNEASTQVVELDTALALATTAMVTARLGAISSTHLSEVHLRRCLGAFMILVAPLLPLKAHISQDTPTAAQATPSQYRLVTASAIGTISGFLSGLFGVGGGAIMVPSLVLSDMSHKSALATSLCAMVVPAVVGTVTHAMRGNVSWRVGPMVAVGSGVGAFFGGREGWRVDESVLRGGFACLMVVLGVKSLRG